jgi:hypothetical protein
VVSRLRSIVLLFAVAGVASGCANTAAVYTEEGLRAGAGAWDAAYKAKATECESKHEAATPEMEGCFGAYFDADAKVGTAIEAAVVILQTYWVARAAGEKPDVKKLAADLAIIIENLPPEVRQYFDRVKGFQ